MSETGNLKSMVLLPILGILLISCGCSGKMPPPAVIAPPLVLLEPCPEPEASHRVLELLDAGRITDAKLEYVNYVLDVRDGFELCNGQLGAVRDFVLSMQEATNE